MPLLRILTYIAASAFAAYLATVGSLLLANSPRAATLLGILVSAKNKQRIRRELPRLRKSQHLITGIGWLVVGLLLGSSVILTLVIHHS